MNPIAEDILMHYGVKRRSGRYPWGSGDSPYQHSGDFYSRVQELKKQGLKETEIVKVMGLDSTKQLRVAYSIAKNERRRLEIDTIKSLQEDGLTTAQIAKKMGKNESSIRSLLDEDSAKRMDTATVTAETLKQELQSKHMIDVGAGVERELGVSRNQLDNALYMLEAEGNNVYGVGIPQVTNPGKQTNTMVLCEPGIAYADVYKNMGDIQSVGDYYSTDGGKTYSKREYPASVGSDRIMVRYADEGGLAKDGVIELRRGVQDLDLGKSHYAQVRILVDGTHYLKGMAMYSDDMPDGIDIIFNSHEKSGTAKKDTFKKIKDDPDNPFGAYIKANGQSKYIDKDGVERLSAINKIKEEGDWDTYSKNLSSQFLSKQPMKLINKQLQLTYDDAAATFDEICSYDNPTVRRKLLLDFANECDAATVHLQAAALPRQESRVILPVTALKDNEVYAPYLKNGERVALVRYPHGGTFEIPELVVNNKNKSAKSILGNVTDAIGINEKVAGKLSGADFDGDSVVVIPLSDKVQVKSTPQLKDLQNFDHRTIYSTTGKSDVRLMKKSEVNREMGIISNLITDMTLKGADEKEIAKATKHSMVVIDAYKHKLDYKQSEKDNDIPMLKKKWQSTYDADGNIIKSGGASTLISTRTQDIRINERQGSGRIDPETGKVTYKESGRTYVDKKTGKITPATITIPRMMSVDDAYELSSGTKQEDAYAAYANKMKALANQSRIEYANTPRLKYDSSASKTYKEEVGSLDAKLIIASMNAPKERRALAVANSVVKAKMQDNPQMDKKEIAKVKQAALEDARGSVGASSKDVKIKITDREWEAIQAGAISDSKLSSILRYTDDDAIKERVMPKTRTALSEAKVNKINSMQQSGYTIADIAEALGVSTSTVSNYLRS